MDLSTVKCFTLHFLVVRMNARMFIFVIEILIKNNVKVMKSARLGKRSGGSHSKRHGIGLCPNCVL